jgi:hypothetical protein
MECMSSLGPTTVEDSSAFLRIPTGQQRPPAGPIGDDTVHPIIRASTSMCSWVLPWERYQIQSAVVLLENPPGPSVLGAAGWSGSGARAPEGLHHKAVVSLGKSAAAQCTGQRRVVPAPGRKPWRVAVDAWVAPGLPWVASAPHPPPPSPVRDRRTRPPRRPMWSYMGFPLPLQVTMPSLAKPRSNEQKRVASSAKHSLPVNLQVPGRHRFATVSILPCTRGECFAWVRGE